METNHIPSHHSLPPFPSQRCRPFIRWLLDACENKGGNEEEREAGSTDGRVIGQLILDCAHSYTAHDNPRPLARADICASDLASRICNLCSASKRLNLKHGGHALTFCALCQAWYDFSSLQSHCHRPACRIFLHVVDIAAVMGSRLLEYYIIIGDCER